MVTLLSIQHVPINLAISIAIVLRFITFWFEFLLSVVIVVLFKVLSLFRKGDKYVKEKI